MFEYKSKNLTEISMSRNDMIVLYEKTNAEWWKGF